MRCTSLLLDCVLIVVEIFRVSPVLDTSIIGRNIESQLNRLGLLPLESVVIRQADLKH